MQSHHVYRGKRFTVIATKHDYSWTLDDVRVEGLPPRHDDDNSYPTWEAAEAAGIKLAQSLIDDEG